MCVFQATILRSVPTHRTIPRHVNACTHVQDHHDNGTAAKLFVNYYGLTAAVKVGSAILLDDGLVSLRVTEVREEAVTCLIENR